MASFALLLSLLSVYTPSFASSLQTRASAATNVGLPTKDAFPPPSPTNKDTTPFPDGAQVGFQGPTPTGAEPELIATASAQPVVQTYFPLVNPETEDWKHGEFNVLRHWGNLSPMFSLPNGTFGVKVGPELPEGCSLKQVHLVHRHGARYPTTSGSLATFAGRLRNATLKGHVSFYGDLGFLANWEYKLGGEVLTSFGRAQMFNLGVGFRQKYGGLLNKFTAANALPVFRTTSEDRMLKSALNFAAGFFGIPYENQYRQSIIIESKGFNNSLAPYYTCPNSNVKSIGYIGDGIMTNWTNIYLRLARERLASQIKGYNLTIADVYAMQQLCSYETVALGYSAFCPLFTEEEFKDYAYSFDLDFWYSSSFGNPTAASIGVGWAQELLARLTHEHTPFYNTSINSTLAASDVTNPLNQSIYVDATHDTTISAIVVALNLTSLAANGPLPTTYRPKSQSFHVEQITPFASQLSVQVMSCAGSCAESHIRFILNDAVIPLTGIGSCKEDFHGLCPLPTFIEGLRKRITEIDFAYDCFANYTYKVPEGGGGIVNGRPPNAP